MPSVIIAIVAAAAAVPTVVGDAIMASIAAGTAVIVVSVGGDNVNDAWFPFTNFDPINLMAFSMPIAHLAPWDRLGLSPFTSSAASILNLQWDGVLQKGSPADFVLLDSNSWVKALSERPKRRVVVNGEFLNELPKNKKSTFNNSHP